MCLLKERCNCFEAFQNDTHDTLVDGWGTRRNRHKEADYCRVD